MATYKAPLADMRFVLHELHEIEKLGQIPGYEEIDAEVVDSVLEEAGKICEMALFPINRSGDEEGCQYSDGVVSTPKGFKEAYAQIAEGGWVGIAADPAYGGQGLPGTVNLMVAEMMCSANLSFSTYVGLTQGAYNALVKHATDEIKQRYVPNMVAGRWSGTMCLTEPQSGTDLGLVRTKAIPKTDGSYEITGTKIFISAGEHDLTENIIHLVLARTPEAPAGIRGISLFLVPKFLLGPDGSVGERNAVRCGSIEHKMGIKASSTCVMNFDGARGYLLGTLHQGMRAMFTMMNLARLEVGVQGVGVAEAAYQGAVAYAREREQGRSLKGTLYPDQKADPIIVHPDVRRMLLTMRAYTEGARALACWVALRLDDAEKHPDPELRKEADDFVALMTPVVKAFFTDIGSEVADIGVQVFGGHGYIREHGMEQYIRDARITQIYEGTNGIQALDLVGRKLPAHFGRYLRRFFHPLQDYLDTHGANPELKDFIAPLAKSFARLQRATGWIAQVGMGSPERAGTAATEYLRLFGLVAMAYMWARMAEVALARLSEGDAEGGEDTIFYRAKVGTARFYFNRLLPQTSSLYASIMAGGDSIMNFEEAAF